MPRPPSAWPASYSGRPTRLGRVVRSGLRPPGAGDAVDGGVVGLDVEEGRAVDAVDRAHGERGALDAEHLDHGQGDRIRAHRRAQGEGAARDALEMPRGLADQVAPRLIHPVEQYHVRIEAQILQPGGVARV